MMRSMAVALAVSGGLLVVPEAPAKQVPENAPLVALLAPPTGRALNADSLRVQALMAAGKPRIRLVELAVDGVVVERVDPQPCRRQVLIDFQVNLATLAPGLHTLMVTAYSGDHRDANAQSANAMFTLDPTLPFAEANEVEEIAVPEPFACLTVKGDPLQEPDRDDDDEDGQGDEAWRRPGRFHVGGTLVTGLQSDRIDLSQDRIVIAVGSEVAVVELGDLRCRERGRDRIACRFEDRSNELVRRLDIRQKRDGRWQFEIDGGPLPADAETFYLRIGNDWGGIDLQTGERITALRLNLDASRQVTAAIGPDGGTIETTDALGVRIRLDVPADALSADTLITMTPLSSSPLADSSTALHPGVKFEPEGLAFGTPAMLTLDFSQTHQAIRPDHFIFLITSPLSTLPLLGRRDFAAGTLTAQLPHFSTTQPSPPVGSTSDFAIARQIISQTGPLSISAIRTLVAYTVVWREQMAMGTLQGISQAELLNLLDRIRIKGLASLSSHISAEVHTLTGNPAREGVAERLIDLEGMRMELGANHISSLSFIRQNLEARINHAADAVTPITPGRRVRLLLDLAAAAQGIGMFDLSDLAQAKISGFLRSLLAQGKQACQTSQAAGRAILDPLVPLASGGAVSTIDPTLAADVQTAITNCGVRSPVTIRKGTAIAPGLGQNIDGTGIKWRADDANENPICCAPVVLLADQPPPVSLVGVRGPTLNVTEPSSGVLAVDVSGSAFDADASWGVFTVRAELVFTTAGVLEMNINPVWFHGGPFILGWALDSGEFGSSSGGTTTIPIMQPGTRIVDIRAAVIHGTASGRAMTITFTPQ